MHMLSKKDLNSAELDTIRVSRNHTTVRTVNGEKQTNEEATVYVNDLDLFLRVLILEGTPAVPSLGKLCEDHGYSYEWTRGHTKTHLVDKMTQKYNATLKITYRSLSRDDQLFFQFDYKYISNIGTAGLHSGILYAKSSNHMTSKETQSSIGRPVARLRRNSKHK